MLTTDVAFDSHVDQMVTPAADVRPMKAMYGHDLQYEVSANFGCFTSVCLNAGTASDASGLILGSSGTPATTPTLDELPVVSAAAARRPAVLVIDEESLSAEHGSLVQKEFEVGTLTKVEKRRLRFIRWFLDRAEESRIGSNLDRIDAAIESNEKVAARLDQLLEAINRRSPGAVRAKRRG